MKAQAAAEAQSVRVHITNAGSDRVFADKTKKQLDFSVSGLDDASAESFKKKVLAFDGVKAFFMKPAENGMRTAHIEFHETYSDNYFRKLLITTGVEFLVVNGKRKKVEEVGGAH